MKKTILVSILAGMASFASAFEQTAQTYVRATPTYNVDSSGNFSGPGIKVALGRTTNFFDMNGAIELEFSYDYFQAEQSLKKYTQKAELNRYTLMANYCVNNTFGTSNVFWYGGLGAGFAVINGSQKTNYTNHAGVTSTENTTTVTSLAPAAKVFLGLGYKINNNCEIYAGGNMVTTTGVKFSNSTALKNYGLNNQNLASVTFGAEVGTKFSF
jgi:hypothetical protein